MRCYELCLITIKFVPSHQLHMKGKQIKRPLEGNHIKTTIHINFLGSSSIFAYQKLKYFFKKFGYDHTSLSQHYSQGRKTPKTNRECMSRT